MSQHDATDIDRYESDARVVFTHDLDFGALLAASGASGPSVIQVRAQNTLPEVIFQIVEMALYRFADQLDRGAIVIVKPSRVRVRVLPLQRKES